MFIIVTTKYIMLNILKTVVAFTSNTFSYNLQPSQSQTRDESQSQSCVCGPVTASIRIERASFAHCSSI